MKDGTTINQREIFLAPFPYSDLSDFKKRPILVLSTNNHLLNNKDFLCCALTSSKKNFYRGIEIENSDLEEGFLKFETAIIPSKIFVINKGKLINKIGKLSYFKAKEVFHKIINEIKIEK